MEFDHINALIVILIFGSLILLSFIKISNPLNINKKGNAWFSVFLLLFASFWVEEIFSYSGYGKINSLVLLVVHSLQIFTAIVLYFSILFYSIPAFRITFKHLPHLIVPLIFMGLQIYDLAYGTKLEYIQVMIVIVILSQSLFYALFSYMKIRKHQKSILMYSSNTVGINLNWLEYILIQIIVICVIVVLHNVFVRTTHLNLLVNSVNLITVYVIAYFSLRQREIFPLKENQEKELVFITEEGENQKEKKKVMSDEDLSKMKKQLLDLMLKSEPYLDSELNLVKLAELMTVTPHQLSYIINSGLGENFFQLINKHRVERAKVLLKDANRMTMLAIAFDAGFNSKTAFNTTFKKMTQQTPSEYRKTCSNL